MNPGYGVVSLLLRLLMKAESLQHIAMQAEIVNCHVVSGTVMQKKER
jgi:hypothetical protein